MRNLKKILAMVLALVMSLSLVTIANAADFTDNDDISYEEAADVMSAIGIIEGFEDGSFDPDGTLTREQAAALVTRMLLGDNADNLGIDGSTFNDVLTTRWSAPAIEYCASLGLIDGAGDGNFYPAGQLTANAFAKILLTALGYDSQKEQMTGSSWSVNVAALAMEVGLDDGIEDLSWSAVLTREEAAQMALNAIQAPLVAYDNDATVTVNGAEVAIGGSDYYYITTTLAREQRISKQTLSNTGEYTVEFGERYFPNLRLTADTDVFDRPSHTWTYETEEIGTYVDYETLVETYTTGVTGRNLYDLIGSTVIKEYDVAYYVDGHENDNIQASNMIRTNTVTYEETGNGVLTQVFVDHDAEEITITSINTYLAFAAADYNEKRGELVLNIYEDKKTDNGANANVVETVEVEEIPAIADILDGDALLVNLAETDAEDYYEVVKIEDPEIMSDASLTKYSALKYLVSGGEQYDYAETGRSDNPPADKYYYGAEELDAYYRSALDNTYDIYLDQYGYVIGTAKVSGELKYLFLTGYDRPMTHLGIKTAQAAAIFLDGEMTEIEVDVNDTNDNIPGEFDVNFDGTAQYVDLLDYESLEETDADYKNANAATWMSRYNRWFTYTVDKDGVYTLKPVENWVNVSKDNLQRDSINSSSVVLRGTVGDGDQSNGTYRAWGNDDSIYITAKTSGNDYTKNIITGVDAVYTGVQDVDIELKAKDQFGEVVFACYDSDGYVIAAVVLGEDVNNTKNFAYGLDAYEAMYEYVEGDDGYTYWDFEAVVDGEIVTLTVKDKYDEVIDTIRDAIVTGDGEDNNKNWVGAMLELTYDADGYVVDAEDLSDGMWYADDNAYEDFIYGNDEYTDPTKFAEDYNVYLVDVDQPAALRTNTAGNTLWINVNGDIDNGLTIAADAPIVVIQEVENSAGRRVDVDVEVYSNFNSAFKALILTQNDEFKGQIAAVLNDRGTAEYVVMNNALNDNIIVNDPNVGNTGDFTINSLAFTNARMEIEITNDTGVDFTSTDIHVVVRNADGNPVYSGYATGAPGGSVDDGETEKVYFGGYTAVPSTSGNYTVTMTVKVGNVTYTATNVIGTI